MWPDLLENISACWGVSVLRFVLVLQDCSAGIPLRGRRRARCPPPDPLHPQEPLGVCAVFAGWGESAPQPCYPAGGAGEASREGPSWCLSTCSQAPGGWQGGQAATHAEGSRVGHAMQGIGKGWRNQFIGVKKCPTKCTWCLTTGSVCWFASQNLGWDRLHVGTGLGWVGSSLWPWRPKFTGKKEEFCVESAGAILEMLPLRWHCKSSWASQLHAASHHQSGNTCAGLYQLSQGRNGVLFMHL